MRPYKLSEGWAQANIKVGHQKEGVKKHTDFMSPVAIEAYNIATGKVVRGDSGTDLAIKIGLHKSVVNKNATGLTATAGDEWVCYRADDKYGRDKAIKRLVEAILAGRKKAPKGFVHPELVNAPKKATRVRTNPGLCSAFELSTGKVYNGKTWTMVGAQIGVSGAYLSKWVYANRGTPIKGRWLLYVNGYLREALGQFWAIMEADKGQTMRIRK